MRGSLNISATYSELEEEAKRLLEQQNPLPVNRLASFDKRSRELRMALTRGELPPPEGFPGDFYFRIIWTRLLSNDQVMDLVMSPDLFTTEDFAYAYKIAKGQREMLEALVESLKSRGAQGSVTA